jgi:DNA polymerase-3 subunit epsilon
MKLAGLDFETANTKSGSICAAGCAVLEDGAVTGSRRWLICPHAGYRWMRPDFTRIHGLCHWDVCNCPEFPVAWEEMREMLLSSDCVVIHNAPFDLGHLKSALALYGLPSVEFDYADSVVITRRLFPGLPSHSLDAMAGHFGITFRHHDALNDAFACASIIARTGIPEGYVRHFQYNAEP